jgi:hypothetical protein
MELDPKGGGDDQVIVGWLITAIKFIIAPIISWAPDDTHIAPIFSGLSSTFGAQLGQPMGTWNFIFPAYEMFVLAHAIAAYFIPAVLIYKLANWVYKHIPQIGGFGPGSG